MRRFLDVFRAELLKIRYAKATGTIVALAVLLQSAFAVLAAKQMASMGLDATPETHAALLDAIPAREYLGFDAILFGLMPMVVFGALHGAAEFKNGGLRTSLLSVHRKGILFTAKYMAITVVSFAVSLIAVVSSIVATHLSLGEAGFGWFAYPVRVWQYMFLSAAAWTFLTVLASVIGFLFRTPIVPLLFLIPQVYNVGNFLAERFPIARLLPVAAGNGLIASSEKALSTDPIRNVTILLVWIVVCGAAGYLRFSKSDGGGAR